MDCLALVLQVFQLHHFSPLVSKHKEKSGNWLRKEMSPKKRSKKINRNAAQKHRLLGPSYCCTVHLLSVQTCAKVTFPSPEKEKSTTKTKSASCTSGKIMLPAASVGWDHAAKKPPSGLWALSHAGLSCQGTQSSRGSWRRGGETVALNWRLCCLFLL